MRARQFVLRTHYSMYRRCPQRWRIATVAMDTPPNLLPVQGLYTVLALGAFAREYAARDYRLRAMTSLPLSTT